MRLISKKSVLRILQEEPSYYDTQNAITEIYDKINELPTIEERKTGRWIEIGYVENDNYNFMCSECRYTDTHTKAEKVNYCWHCGAMMEGAEK